ncbi:hypothetical protein DL764_009903 [Monosporascus ibericus]|uniref:GLEYA adhesin domain-containing protein n=1 Tax=Monosporascus ibericus TaxID=155417 RepID=A0A4Q4SWL4_9PEZI|nr:hypothetical protein DL764_009903 [Monosporascus ibericus]
MAQKRQNIRIARVAAAITVTHTVLPSPTVPVGGGQDDYSGETSAGASDEPCTTAKFVTVTITNRVATITTTSSTVTKALSFGAGEYAFSVPAGQIDDWAYLWLGEDPYRDWTDNNAVLRACGFPDAAGSIASVAVYPGRR